MAEHRYGLVDASMRTQLPVHCVQSPIAPKFLGLDTERCPALIDLHSLTPQERGDLSDLLERQLSNREETICSLLLSSPLSAQSTASQLAQRISIQVEPHELPKQFRFFDPGTFLQLPELLGDAGMAWLLQSAGSVLVPWAGCWTRFDKPTEKAPFRLAPSHVKALQRVGVVNRVAAQSEVPSDARHWIARCKEIDRYVERGQVAYGLSHQADLVAFARHATRYHPAFDSHPVVQRLLKLLREATREDELDYREITSRLTPADWQGVVQELNVNAETERTIR